MARLIRALLSCYLCLSLLACSSLQPLPVTGMREAGEKIHVGDKLLLTLKDGTQRELTVAGVEAAGIRGDNTLVQWQQIQSIEKRRFSLGKTLGLSAGILASIIAVCAVLVRIMFAHLDDDLDKQNSAS